MRRLPSWGRKMSVSQRYTKTPLLLHRRAAQSCPNCSSNSPSLSPNRRRRMSIINYASREIQFKIVFYGPALCGKTTNLNYIHQRINPRNRGDLVSLATAAERTLFFDFLPRSEEHTSE